MAELFLRGRDLLGEEGRRGEERERGGEVDGFHDGIKVGGGCREVTRGESFREVT